MTVTGPARWVGRRHQLIICGVFVLSLILSTKLALSNGKFELPQQNSPDGGSGRHERIQGYDV